MSLYQQLVNKTMSLQTAIDNNHNNQPITQLASEALEVLNQALNIMGGDQMTGSLNKTLPTTLNRSTDFTNIMQSTCVSSVPTVNSNSANKNIVNKNNNYKSSYVSTLPQRNFLSSKIKYNSTNISDLQYKIKKMTSQRKQTRSKTELTINVLKGKLKAATQRNENYVCEIQCLEVALQEASEIIRSLRNKLKRTWATNPHIAMSPRTKKILAQFQTDRASLLLTNEHTNETSNNQNNDIRCRDNLLIKDAVPLGRQISFSSLVNCSLDQGKLASELFVFAKKLSTKQELEAILIYDEHRRLLWLTKASISKASTERINDVYMPKSLFSKTEAKEWEYSVIASTLGPSVSGKISKSSLWLPLSNSSGSTYVGFMIVKTNANEEKTATQLKNTKPTTSLNSEKNDVTLLNWSLFGQQIKTTIETCVLLNRVQAVFDNVVVRLPSLISSSSSLGPIWKLLESSGKEIFPNSIHISIRTLDIEKSEFVRYINEPTDQHTFHEVRHSISTGQPTYNRNREGRYRGYGMELIDSSKTNHPLIISRFDEEKDDAFISFGPARAVLACTLANEKGQASGIIEIARRLCPYSLAEEATFEQYSRTIYLLLTLAKALFKKQKQIDHHVSLYRCLKPLSLSSLTGKAQLLHTLSVHTLEILRVERCLWFTIDDTNKCFRSKLSEHGTEIVQQFGSTILDTVRKTKKYICLRDVVNAKGTEAQHLCDSNYVKTMGEVISTLAVPLIDSSGKVVGVAQVINKIGSGEPFDYLSIETLSKLASYAAIALENFQLLNDVLKQQRFALDHLEDLHTSSEVIETVSRKFKF